MSTLLKRKPRRLLAAVGAGAVMLAGMTTAITAQAAHPELSLAGSSFEIDTDANLKVDDPAPPSLDWANVVDDRRDDAPTGQNDDSYQGGTKEDTACPGTTTGSIPNNKSDLLTFGVYEEAGDPGYLHMFWSRVNDPSGTTLMDFEFNQSSTDCDGAGPAVNPVRTAGDILLEYAIDQGGAQANVTIRFWDGAAWGPSTNLTETGDATGSINSSPIPAADSDDLITTGELAPRTFGEATIDLDVLFDEGKCTSFGSAMLKSRASDSFTSQLKDYIAPVPIDLQNCGNVIIRKQTLPDEDPNTTEFGYTKNFDTDPATPHTFTLTDDGVQDYGDDVLFGTGYTVTEDVIPLGWEFVSLDCSASTGVTPVIVGTTVTFDIDADTDVLDCTYTNQSFGSITVVKQTSDGFGAFDFTSTTLIPASFTLTTTAPGAAGQDSRLFDDLAPGTYDVAETVPAGWNLTSATCDDGSDPASIGLSAGEDVTCTFVNARETGAIEITKTRKHAADGSGDHPHEGVTFTVTGGELPAEGVTVVTDAAGQACTDGLLLSSFAGDYTVTETLPAGYVPDGDLAKSVTVTQESTCGDGNEATVSFSNTPLTDITVSVNSQVDGGTASTIDCTLDGTSLGSDPTSTGVTGDGSTTHENLVPGTYVCTVFVDP